MNAFPCCVCVSVDCMITVTGSTLVRNITLPENIEKLLDKTLPFLDVARNRDPPEAIVQESKFVVDHSVCYRVILRLYDFNVTSKEHNYV